MKNTFLAPIISIRFPVTSDNNRKENVAREIVVPIESSPILRSSAISGISGPIIRLVADTTNIWKKPNTSI
jgi:hypothetical protein